MKIRKPGIKFAVIAGGFGVLAIGAAAAYWQLQERQWCLRFTSNGGQEVTYSWGCHNPRRYKQWVVTASNPNLSSLHRQQLMAPGHQIR
jgi:hypothetical protein